MGKKKKKKLKKGKSKNTKTNNSSILSKSFDSAIVNKGIAQPSFLHRLEMEKKKGLISSDQLPSSSSSSSNNNNNLMVNRKTSLGIDSLSPKLDAKVSRKKSHSVKQNNTSYVGPIGNHISKSNKSPLMFNVSPFHGNSNGGNSNNNDNNNFSQKSPSMMLFGSPKVNSFVNSISPFSSPNHSLFSGSGSIGSGGVGNDSFEQDSVLLGSGRRSSGGSSLLSFDKDDFDNEFFSHMGGFDGLDLNNNVNSNQMLNMKKKKSPRKVSTKINQSKVNVQSLSSKKKDKKDKTKSNETNKQSNNRKSPNINVKRKGQSPGKSNYYRTQRRSSYGGNQSSFIEHPLGEHPSRTLFVRNISSNVEDEELRKIFEEYGEIRNLYTQCKHRGFVMVSYYDIRHSKGAMKNLQGISIKRRKIDIHYSIPKDNPSEKDMNQGTLVVFNLDPSISNGELKKIFGKYGQVKEIRETPNKKHHKFIEYYDVRDAENGMKNLNRAEIRGKRIKIEPSRPGGTRRNSFSNSRNDQDKKSPRSGGRYIKGRKNKTRINFSLPNQSRLKNSIEKGGSFKEGNHANERLRSKNRIASVEERKKYLLDYKKVTAGQDKRTTLMIKNIPNKYTQRMLLHTINESFKGTYDFIYLPIDFKNRCNVGYAFINFIKSTTIVKFAKIFNNKKWGKFNSEKVCELSYARIQGKKYLIEHFQNSSLMCEDITCRPIIFHSSGSKIGKEMPFPISKKRRKSNAKRK